MKNVPRLIASLLLGVFVSSCATVSKPVKESYSGIIPEIQTQKSVTYDGIRYLAGYSALTKNGSLVEYFKPGEGPQRWTKMIGLRTTNPPSTPQGEVHSFASLARSTKGSGAIYSNTKTGEVGIDCMLPKSDGVEFNIFRYVPQNGGTKSFQYAELIPRSKLETTNGSSLRKTRLKSFLSMEIPNIHTAP